MPQELEEMLKEYSQLYSEAYNLRRKILDTLEWDYGVSDEEMCDEMYDHFNGALEDFDWGVIEELVTEANECTQ